MQARTVRVAHMVSARNMRVFGLLQGGMAAEAGLPELVFVEHFEQRRPVGKNAKKLPASNFYLRDSLGRQHLAGQADAHGDAHYTYHNTKAFGARFGEVSCHNKKEMISYLDRIIQVRAVSRS